MDARTSSLTRKLGAWAMPDEMVAKLAAIYANNRGLGPNNCARIGERRIVAAIRERYGVGVSTHTVVKWFRDNKDVLDENLG